MNAAQVLRIVAMSSCAAILGLIAVVLHVFVLSWRRQVRVGFLPWHIVGLSLYAINASIKDTWALLGLFRDDAPLTHFGVMTLAGNAVLIVSLLSVFVYGRRRLQAERPSPPPRRERRWPGRAERTGPPPNDPQ